MIEFEDKVALTHILTSPDTHTVARDGLGSPSAYFEKNSSTSHCPRSFSV